MRMPFRDRSLFFKLLSANIITVSLIALAWFAVNSYYMGKSDRADDILSTANRIRAQVLQLRRCEKDFFLMSLNSREFYETGESNYLAKHRKAFSSLHDLLLDLQGLLGGKDTGAYQELKSSAGRYNETFLQLVDAYRARGYYNWGVVGELREAIHKVEGELEKTSDLNMRVHLLQLRRSEKDYLLRGEKRYLEKIEESLNQLRDDARQLGAAAGARLLEYLEIYEKAFNRYQAIEKEIGLDEKTGLRGKLRSAIQRMEPAVDRVVRNASRAKQAARKDTLVMNLVTLLLGLMAGYAVFYSFARSITRPLVVAAHTARKMASGDLTMEIPPYERKDEVGVLMEAFRGMLSTLRDQARQMIEGAGTVSSSISELSATVGQLASTSAETSSSVVEVTTTVEEVRQTATLSNEKARLVAEKAEETYEVSESGREASIKNNEGMDLINQEMLYIAEVIMKLSEHMQSIGDIINSVNDIADQSNLLSVNASIEAAKAGEYGKGFAVVAQEVKSLADQSREATSRIRSILNDIQKATTDAVMATERGTKAVKKGRDLAARLGDTIGVLTENIAESAQSAAQISASSEQQLIGMAQLAQAMESIKEASVQNVDGARQLEEAIKGLEELGRKLRDMAGRFRV